MWQVEKEKTDECQLGRWFLSRVWLEKKS